MPNNFPNAAQESITLPLFQLQMGCSDKHSENKALCRSRLAWKPLVTERILLGLKRRRGLLRNSTSDVLKCQACQ